MDKKNKIITGIAVLFAVTIPVISMAATGNMPDFIKGFGGKSDKQVTLLTDSTARALLESKGVKLPTVEEIKVFHDKTAKVQESMKNLSDTDRDFIEKARRDAMRAKGIALPSEEELAAHKALQTQIQNVMKNLTPEEKTKLGFGKKHGEKMFGEKGGKGRGRMMDGAGFNRNEGVTGEDAGFQRGFHRGLQSGTGTTATGTVK